MRVLFTPDNGQVEVVFSFDELGDAKRFLDTFYPDEEALVAIKYAIESWLQGKRLLQ